jgi:hypothetical protein
MNFTTTLEVIQQMRSFARLAKLEGRRLEAEQRFDEAMKFYLAIYKSGRLTRNKGCLIQALVGIAIDAVANEDLLRLSQNPDLDATSLRELLRELKATNEKFEPTSSALKAEYIILDNSLNRPDWISIVGFNGTSESLDYYLAPLQHAFFWVVAEPELSRRLAAQMLVNQAPEFDKPICERRPTASTTTYLFEIGKDSRPGQLRPQAIDIYAQQSLVARQIFPAMRQFETATNRDIIRRTLLPLAIAAQIYRREHGEYPDSENALIPDLIEAWPKDPLDAHGAALEYTRESADIARIRSLGNGVYDIDLKIKQP